MPPEGEPYWYIGFQPGTRAGLKGRMRMARARPGEAAPAWATHWACEGMDDWVRFPAAGEGAEKC